MREYLLHLTTVRKIAPSSFIVALCGIRFFYEQTLGRHWTVLDVAHPKREKKLPVVLSRDEVWQVLAAVRNPIYRACLTTTYACGLRLLEGARLQVPDVDGARTLLHIRHGKTAPDNRDFINGAYRGSRHPLGTVCLLWLVVSRLLPYWGAPTRV